jgi:hypothetical protein
MATALPVPQLVQAAIPAVRPHSSFSQLYGDDTKDPCRRNYRQVMIRYDARRQDAILGPTLLQQVLNASGSVPQAFLCCGTTVNGPRIFCVHFPSRYVGAVDGTVSVWYNMSFAFLGEVVHGLVSIVTFSEEAFNIVEVRVKSVNYMLQHLEELQELPVFPPVFPDDDEAEYTPLLLSASGYTPKQTWEILHPAMVQRQELEICVPLLRWLQAASVGTALVNPLEMGAQSFSIQVHAPSADEQLLTQRHSILHQALPGLAAPPQGLEMALSQMAAALIAQTNDNQQAREQ